MAVRKIGVVVQIGDQDVLVLEHNPPQIKGINVLTGEVRLYLKKQIDSVLAGTFKRYILKKSQETLVGNYFVGKVCQNANGDVGYVTAFTPMPKPMWDGVDLGDQSAWRSVAEVPTLVADSLGDFTTEMLNLASQRRSKTKPSRDHAAKRQNIPKS